MLTSVQRSRCFKTISSNALFFLAMDALEAKEPFSIVRMADGEHHLWNLIQRRQPEQLLLPAKSPTWLSEDWLRRMGLYQIPFGLLRTRMETAATRCTFYAPSPTGLVDPMYNMYDFFPTPANYAEHFFNILWNDDQKRMLFQRAGHVLCIHRNAHTADSMQLRVQAGLNVKVSYIHLANWTQSEDVIKKAKTCTAPVVLFSGGPASKYIGPAIAETNKVVLDIGNQMDRYTFSDLPVDRIKASAFHQQWALTNSQWVEQHESAKAAV